MKQGNLAELLFEAEKAQQAGAWQQAYEFYQQALALAPERDDIRAALTHLATVESTEEEVQDIITAADSLMAGRQYEEARNLYDRALNRAGQGGILKYHAMLEDKKIQAKNLAVWQERVQSEVGAAGKQSERGDNKGALAALKKLRGEVPELSAYDELRQMIDAARLKIEGAEDGQALYDGAIEALESEDWEGAMQLFEAVPTSHYRYEEAQKQLRQTRTFWERFGRPVKQRIERAVEQGEWSNAFAELDLFRHDYPRSPVWRELWLQTGMKSGQQALGEGRELNAQREFLSAQERFEAAREAFNKVIEVYPTHTTAPRLHEEALDLAQVAAQEHQADLLWKVGRRQEAKAALGAAASRITQARTQGREYTTVAAVVEAMERAISAELEQIKVEANTIQDGERLLGERRLDEAGERFKSALNAIASEHRARATRGLNQVDEAKSHYQADLQQGKEAPDAYQAVTHLQRAYERWPGAPGVVKLLVEALVKAGEQALIEHRDAEAVTYADRALELDPLHRAASNVREKPGVRAKVQAALIQSETTLQEMAQRDLEAVGEPRQETYRQLLERLQGARAEASQHPDLKSEVERRIESIQAAAEEWRTFEEGVERAQLYQQRGEWEQAVAELANSMTPLGHHVPPSVRSRLAQWQRIEQRIRELDPNLERALRQAQEDHANASTTGDYKSAPSILQSIQDMIEEVLSLIQYTGGKLPPHWEVLSREATDLLNRAEVAERANLAPTAMEGLTLLRETMRRERGSDETLRALEVRLSERLKGEAETLLARADTELEAGNLSEAVALLRQVHELQPDNREVSARYAMAQRRERLVGQLRTILIDAETKQTTASLSDARDAFQRGLELLATAEELPQTFRQLLLELFRLHEEEERLAFGKKDKWEAAQERLLSLDMQLPQLPGWAMQWAGTLIRQWAHLAHDVALRGVMDSSASLQEHVEAYRAAVAYMRRHSNEEEAIGLAARRREEMLNHLNASARRRLDRAKMTLEEGNFEIALNNIASLETDVYQKVEVEFPETLGSTVEAVRNEAAQLRARAERLRIQHEQIRPLVEEAEQAFFNGQLDEAEQKLRAVPPADDLPTLGTKVSELRRNVQEARHQKSSRDMYALLVRAEAALKSATTSTELANLLSQLDALPTEVNLQLVTSEQREHYFQLVEQVRDAHQALLAGTDWATEAQAAKARGDFVQAERALQAAIEATRRADQKVALHTQLYQIEAEARRQRQREEAVQQGQEALLANDYGNAQKRFLFAQSLGAEVKDLLHRSQAGVRLERARRLWQEEQDGQLAQDVLQEAYKLVEPYPEAEDLLDEIRSWQRRIGRQQDVHVEIFAKLMRVRRALTPQGLDEAEGLLQEILIADPRHQEALALHERLRLMRQAQLLMAQANEATQRRDYETALSYVSTILSNILPDYADALALKGRLETGQDAIKALRRAETLTRNHEFQAARKALDEAVEKGAEVSRVDEVRQAIEEQEKAWASQTISPIRHAFMDGRYAEALSLSHDVLRVAGTAGFQGEVESLQADIVNRWAEKTIEELRLRSQRQPDEYTFELIRRELDRFTTMTPPPAMQWQQELSRLRRQVDEERLKRMLESARHEAEQARWDEALSIINRTLREANELGLGRLSYDATLLENQVLRQQEKVTEQQYQEQRQELLTLIHQHGELPKDRRSLEHARAAVLKLLAIERFQQDADALAWRDRLDQQLRVYDETQTALTRSRDQMLQNRLQEADISLRLLEVSSLLQEQYNQQRTLVSLLRQGEEEQKREEWESAFQIYQTIVGLDASLLAVVERDMERCRSNLTRQLLREAQQFLTTTPPDPQAASNLLDRAEQGNMLASSFIVDVRRLREWIKGLDSYGRAERLLQAEDGSLTEILALLGESAQHASDPQFQGTITQVQQLTQALLAWQQGDIDMAEGYLRTLLPSIINRYPRAQKLQNSITQAQAITAAYEQTRQAVKGALNATPIRAEEAVQAMRPLLLLDRHDPRVQELLGTLQTQLRHLLDSERRSDRFDQALKVGSWMAQLDPHNSMVQGLLDELREERMTLFASLLAETEQALHQDDTVTARVILARATEVMAPQGDERIRHLATRVKLRQEMLDAIDTQIIESQVLLRQRDWEAVVPQILAMSQDAATYPPVVHLREESQGRLLALAQEAMQEGNYDRATWYCQLTLRLGTHEAALHLRDTINQTRDARLTQLRSEAQGAIEDWELRRARMALQSGFDLAPEDALLQQLSSRLDVLEAHQEMITGSMEAGWTALRQRDYYAARAAFESVVQKLPDLSEAQRWLDYTNHLEQAFHLMADEQANQKGQQIVSLLEAARKRVVSPELVPLPGILSDQWSSRRRQAHHDAEQLEAIAIRVVNLERHYERSSSERRVEEALEALNEITKQREIFLRLHRAPTQVSEGSEGDASSSAMIAPSSSTLLSDEAASVLSTERLPEPSSTPPVPPTPLRDSAADLTEPSSVSPHLPSDSLARAENPEMTEPVLSTPTLETEVLPLTQYDERRFSTPTDIPNEEVLQTSLPPVSHTNEPPVEQIEEEEEEDSYIDYSSWIGEYSVRSKDEESGT